MRPRVLVLGGAGYIGSVLTPRLLRVGYEVVVFDRLIHHIEPRPSPSLRLVQGDIRDPSSVANASRGCTEAVHLAGISIDGAIKIPYEVARAINLESFKPVLLACLGAGVERFIFASTCSVYGNRPGTVVETALPQPNTLYGQWKLACEETLFSYSNQVEAIALRAATTCGPSPRQRFDLLINRMSAAAFFERRIGVASPNAIRPSVHIDDLVDAYVALLAAKPSEVAGEVFHCAYESRTQRETALLVREVMGIDVRLEALSGTQPRSYSVDSTKIANRVGFSPRREVREAVQALKVLFDAKRFADALTSTRYDNRAMESVALRHSLSKAAASSGACSGS